MSCYSCLKLGKNTRHQLGEVPDRWCDWNGASAALRWPAVCPGCVQTATLYWVATRWIAVTANGKVSRGVPCSDIQKARPEHKGESNGAWTITTVRVLWAHKSASAKPNLAPKTGRCHWRFAPQVCASSPGRGEAPGVLKCLSKLVHSGAPHLFASYLPAPFPC